MSENRLVFNWENTFPSSKGDEKLVNSETCMVALTSNPNLQHNNNIDISFSWFLSFS